MRAAVRLRRVIAALILGMLGLSGCAAVTGADGDAGTPTIVVTTNILGDLTEQVVGEHADVVTLMAPEADPHAFEISAQQAARIQDADLVVASGLGLEEGVQQHLDRAEASDVPVFTATDHIEVLEYADGEASGSPDPHWWTGPGRTADVVEALTDTVAGIDGVDAAAVTEAGEAYRAEVVALEAEMTDAFDAIPPARRKLVTNHHVFGYLADRFGFEMIGAVIPGGTTLAAPSAADLRDLADAIESAGVPTIFAESSQPDRLIQVLAEEAGVEVEVTELFTESLTRPGGGAPTYLALMRANTARIAEGLSPA